LSPLEKLFKKVLALLSKPADPGLFTEPRSAYGSWWFHGPGRPLSGALSRIWRWLAGCLHHGACFRQISEASGLVLRMTTGNAEMIHQHAMIVAGGFKTDPVRHVIFPQDRDQPHEVIGAVGNRPAPPSSCRERQSAARADVSKCPLSRMHTCAAGQRMPTRTRASEVCSTLAMAGLLCGVVRKTTIETRGPVMAAHCAIMRLPRRP